MKLCLNLGDREREKKGKRIPFQATPRLTPRYSSQSAATRGVKPTHDLMHRMWSSAVTKQKQFKDSQGSFFTRVQMAGTDSVVTCRHITSPEVADVVTINQVLKRFRMLG